MEPKFRVYISKKSRLKAENSGDNSVGLCALRDQPLSWRGNYSVNSVIINSAEFKNTIKHIQLCDICKPSIQRYLHLSLEICHPATLSFL